MLTSYVPVRSPLSMAGRACALVLAFFLALAALPVAAPIAQQVGEEAAQALAPWGHFPLAFMPNQGQADPAVQFQAQSLGGTAFFTPQEVVLALPPAAAEQPASSVRLGFVDANPVPTITASDRLPGHVNDLRGADPQQWRTDIPTYGSVVYEDLYTGIDLRYAGAGGTLKGTYTVAPGIDPGRIRWQYQGVEQVRIDHATGDVRITVAADQVLTEAAPVAWQNIGEQHVPVQARYHLAADGTIGFALGTYNAAYPLIIDPILDYGTYLGGEGNEAALGIAVDAAGNMYLAGLTNSPNFPTKNAFDSQYNVAEDAFIAKLSADGHTLLYSTYLGGTRNDSAWSIAIDGAGNAYVSGLTSSGDFPTTLGAFDRTLEIDPSQNAGLDAFVTKLNAAGNALLYSSYLGGASFEGGFIGPRVAVDAAGNAYVTSSTSSPNFPTTAGAFDRTLEIDPSAQVGTDAFVTKVNAHGSALVYSTFLGGVDIDVGWGIAVDQQGNAYVTGDAGEGFPTVQAAQPRYAGRGDSFVTKLNAAGSALVYSTFLGGTNTERPGNIAVDAAGSAYVSGFTFSTDFPVKHALQPTCKRCDSGEDTGYDAYVTKLNPQGTTLVYSTYLGGTGLDDALGLAVNAAGEAHVAGATTSRDFPLQNALGTWPGDTFNGYVAKLSADGRALIYATYVGGSEVDYARAIVLDRAGTAYVAGETFSTDFPTKHPLQPSNAGFSDAFVVKLRDQGGRPQLYLPMVTR